MPKEFFEGKHVLKKLVLCLFADLDRKFLAKKNIRQGCQKSILLFQRNIRNKNFLKKVEIVYLVLDFEPNMLDFWQKTCKKFVKTAFYLARGTFNGDVPSEHILFQSVFRI